MEKDFYFFTSPSSSQRFCFNWDYEWGLGHMRISASFPYTYTYKRFWHVTYLEPVKIKRTVGLKNIHSLIVDSSAQSCPTLCDPMDHSMSGLPVYHQLPESIQTHLHWVGDTIQPSHLLSSPSPLAFNLQSFPASGSFEMSQLFSSGGQSIGVSASTSVLPMNTQDLSPLEWTGLMSLQSKGLSRVFSNTTVQKHHSYVLFNGNF